jgi:hypothetical protein
MRVEIDSNSARIRLKLKTHSSRIRLKLKDWEKRFRTENGRKPDRALTIFDRLGKFLRRVAPETAAGGNPVEAHKRASWPP